MPEPLPAALERVATLVLDDERLVRAVAAGRRKGRTPPPWRRTELRYVDLESGRHLQVVEYDDTQAFTRNIPAADARSEVTELLGTPYGNWHVDTTEQTLQLRVTKKGDAQVHVAKADNKPPDRKHDRTKSRVIDPREPFLRAIGITDRDGRIKPTRKDKYRQVEEFVRLLGPAVDDARAAGTVGFDHPLGVVDLGCGNAYLTFAARGFLGEGTTLTGIDVKAQARERNSRIAAELGWDASMTFVQGTIAEALPGRPDVVLALHACDTATDDALAVAVRSRAPVILAAPCCHHDLQKQLRAQPTPDPYGLVTRHGILRERLADMLTDGLRAAILRIAGYRVDVVEFVDSAHTPRNLMIRAVSTGTARDQVALDEYRALTSAWGVRPALAGLLAAELPELEAAG